MSKIKRPDEEKLTAVFEKGDVVVSENREFRLIMDIVRWNDSCLAYKWCYFKKHTIKDIFGREIVTEALDENTQPTSIVERYFHLFELK